MLGINDFHKLKNLVIYCTVKYLNTKQYKPHTQTVALQLKLNIEIKSS